MASDMKSEGQRTCWDFVEQAVLASRNIPVLSERLLDILSLGRTSGLPAGVLALPT